MKDRLSPNVVYVYQDEETRRLVEAAAGSLRSMKNMVPVHGVDALVAYLDTCHPMPHGDQPPCPNLILLDVSTSLAPIRETLFRLKRDGAFRAVPVVVLASPDYEDEAVDTYDLGVNAFVRRSGDPDVLANTLQVIENFWLNVVTLPHAERPVRMA